MGYIFWREKTADAVAQEMGISVKEAQAKLKSTVNTYISQSRPPPKELFSGIAQTCSTEPRQSPVNEAKVLGSLPIAVNPTFCYPETGCAEGSGCRRP